MSKIKIGWVEVDITPNQKISLAGQFYERVSDVVESRLYVTAFALESDNDCVKKADKIVVDYWEGIKHRMISTVALMWKDGLVQDSDIHAELGQILCGFKTPRENDDEIIYFNAVGAGILDIAVVARCYLTAKQNGKGIVLPFWE